MTVLLVPLQIQFSFSSVTLLCPTLCNPMDWSSQASLSIINSWSLLKLMSIESEMPSNHLILCRPLLLLPSIFPSIRVVSNESLLHIRWPKYWSFSFSISPSNEFSGLISLRKDCWISLQAKGLSRVFSNTTVQKNQFFGAGLSWYSYPHMTTGKTISLIRQHFVGKVMSLLFYMLSRLVIAFLPRNKCLLISWIAVTICSDFGDQKKMKSLTVSTVSPSICH